MNEFTEALLSESRSASISEEDDFYGKFIGYWDCLWVDSERKVKGEWYFSRILKGTAIQDLFILPSREEVLINPQADSEYGTNVRFYNPKTHNWDIFYGVPGVSFRLEAVKDGNKIVHTEITKKKLRWVFAEIKDDSFIWEKYNCDDNGA